MSIYGIYNDLPLRSPDQVLADYAEQLISIASQMLREADDMEAYAKKRGTDTRDGSYIGKRAALRRERAGALIYHARRLEQDRLVISEALTHASSHS